MLSDVELMNIFDKAMDWPNGGNAQVVGFRAVAEAAAKQALVDIGKYIVETPEMVQGMQGYLNDWHHPESVLEWIRDEIDARAASISTDKAGAAGA